MAEEYDVQAIMNALKTKEEMDPDQHDGCYELMRETIKAYGRLDDFSILDYKDLNLVYLTTVGTWKQGIDSKKKTVNDSHLTPTDKEFLTKLWDEVWDKAGREEYTNYEMDAAGNRSIGMFGTGFFSFQKNTTDIHARAFIKMCVDILPMTDDNAMYDRASEVLTTSFKGMKAASASMILHCLKPFTFPVLNSNMGNRNIFEVLGVDLIKRDSLETYVENCRRIKAFRDRNFSYKNYRIFDMAAWKVKEYVMSDSEKSEEDEWWPSLEEYDPGITAREYFKYFSAENIVKRTWVKALYELSLMPEHMASCKQLGDKYGHSPSQYNRYFSSAGQNIQKVTGIGSPEDDQNAKYWPILFQGKSTADGYCYKLREPVIHAISMLMSTGMFLEKENDNVVQFDRNLILYGPPGTGKTYHSVIYAVAICECKELDEVKNEAYQDVLDRYRELKEEGRIAFTTFHQSYGYEEFIEGIKPKLNSENESLGYTIEDGVFKAFCKRAGAVKVDTSDDHGLKANPHIWGMLLGGTGSTEIKQYCFDNNVIRFAWDHITDNDLMDDNSEISKNEKFAIHQLSTFIYSMEVGDLVIIAKNITTIDAIGVITGEYEYDLTKETHSRTRNVKWLVKNVEFDIRPFLPNGRKQLPTSYLYPLDYLGIDNVSKILDELNERTEVYFETETKPYVFIIDEINRGNISKIFGELITLIEGTKRAGAPEAMEAILPYSGETFSVPNNVYIIGTMNTADRSIALMDTALRRRFEFVEMMPETEVLENLGIAKIDFDGVELNIGKMLAVMNQRIKYLYDREHTIGHAFFIPLSKDASLDTLANIFEKKIIPLLQEYFYEDYEKIQLVLGDETKQDEYKFILDQKIDPKDVFNGHTEVDLPPKGYEIQHSAFYKDSKLQADR